VVSNFSPAMAVPITVKIPEPITAPIPSAVNETGPSVFFNACSGLSDSEISLSIDLVAKICLASALAPACRWIGAGRFRLHDAISEDWIQIRVYGNFPERL
jgi:hypothetical protein